MDFFVTVRHLRRYVCDEVSQFGGVTIAAVVDLTDPDNRVIRFTLAFCSEHDHFDRNVGRAIALERLLDEANIHTCAYTDYEQGGSISDHIAQYMSGEEVDPESARLFFSHQDEYC